MNLFINLVLVISATLAITFGVTFYIREKNAGKIRVYILCMSIATFLTCSGYAVMSFSSDLTAAFLARDIGLLGIEIYPLCVLFLMASDMKIDLRKQRAFHYIFLILILADLIVFGHPDANTFIRNGNYTSYVMNNSYRHLYHYIYMILLICTNLLMAAKWYKSMHYKREKRFVIIAIAANSLLFLGGALDCAANHFGFPSPYCFYCMGIAISFFVFWRAARKNSVFVISLQSMSEDIFDSINTAILVFDFDKRLNLCNPFARQLLEIESDKINEPNSIFEMNDELQNKIFEDAQNGITRQYRLKTLTNMKSCQVTCQVKMDEDREPICLIMVVTDMTKEDMLIQEAYKANKAKSVFLAHMSHEIRTPINAVLGMNEMILRESNDANIKEYALDIQSAGRQLLSLINSVLDFSKIEDGKMKILPVGYDVATLINDLVNSVASMAEKKSLDFKVNVDSMIPMTLYGDDVRIRQVVSNLLTNAVKYTNRGSVSLLFKQIRNYDGKVDLYIEVTDTGIGIREEDIQRLSEAFQRLDENRNRSIEGTGLGISIVTKLLEMMGSKLSLKSTYGKGSAFSFVLTQRIINDEPIGYYEKRLIISQESKESESYLQVRDAKILVVDDNDMNIKVLRSLMKRNGIVPDTALSGADAIRLVRKKQYHIIFMDHMMSKMDGIETLKKMKRERILSDSTVVIALTANAIAGAREEYLQAGVDDYLCKPIDVQELEERLEKYLASCVVDAPKSNENKAVSKINYMAGRKFCMNDEGFYRDMMTVLLNNESDKKLQMFFEQKDWENYRIAVHALKGNMLNIGAEEAAEIAKSLELELKEGNIEYVLEHNEEFLTQYSDVLSEIEEYLKS